MRKTVRGGTLVEYLVIVAMVLGIILAAFRAFGGTVGEGAKKFGACVVTFGSACGAGDADHSVADIKGTVKVEGCRGGICLSPGNCFAPGTLVSTPRGPQAIESLHVGDTVLSRDDHGDDATVRASKITRVFSHDDKALVDLELVRGSVHERVAVTPEHPFFTSAHGWTAAGALDLGDAVVTTEGPATVTSMASHAETSTVWNLEVENTHTFYVGAVEAWVHNDCTPSGIPGFADLEAKAKASSDKTWGDLYKAVVTARDEPLTLNVTAIGDILARPGTTPEQLRYGYGALTGILADSQSGAFKNPYPAFSVKAVFERSKRGSDEQKKAAAEIAMYASHDVTVDKMGTKTTPRKDSPMFPIFEGLKRSGVSVPSFVENTENSARLKKQWDELGEMIKNAPKPKVQVNTRGDGANLEDFVFGFAGQAKDTGTGLVDLVSDPGKAVEGVIYVFREPGKAFFAMRAQARGKSTAELTGRATFEGVLFILPETLFLKGGKAAELASHAAKLEEAATIARAAGKTAEAGKLAEEAALARSLVEAARLGKGAADIAKEAVELAKEAQLSGKAHLAENADRLAHTAEEMAKLQKSAAAIEAAKAARVQTLAVKAAMKLEEATKALEAANSAAKTARTAAEVGDVAKAERAAADAAEAAKAARQAADELKTAKATSTAEKAELAAKLAEHGAEIAKYTASARTQVNAVKEYIAAVEDALTAAKTDAAEFAKLKGTGVEHWPSKMATRTEAVKALETELGAAKSALGKVESEAKHATDAAKVLEHAKTGEDGAKAAKTAEAASERAGKEAAKTGYREVDIRRPASTGDPNPGEFDGIDLGSGTLAEDKAVKGLGNPKNPQTPAEWAQKQVYDKTVKHLDGLQHPDAGLFPKKGGSPIVPDISKVRELKQLVFRFQVDPATVPGLAEAVKIQIDALKLRYPNWNIYVHWRY